MHEGEAGLPGSRKDSLERLDGAPREGDIVPARVRRSLASRFRRVLRAAAENFLCSLCSIPHADIVSSEPTKNPRVVSTLQRMAVFRNANERWIWPKVRDAFPRRSSRFHQSAKPRARDMAKSSREERSVTRYIQTTPPPRVKALRQVQLPDDRGMRSAADVTPSPQVLVGLTPSYPRSRPARRSRPACR